MTIPDRNDFLDYAEGAPLKSSDVQKNVLLMLASSKIYREQCAEIQRDLYLIDTRVPEYSCSEFFYADLAVLAKDWAKLRTESSISPYRKFTKSKEFYLLIAGISAAVLLLMHNIIRLLR